MSRNWSTVRLGEALLPVSRPVIVDTITTYSILGAHWYAKGLYTKDVLPGSEIRAKHLYKVEQGDFVYNRLFGWKGSFAVATRENDGCYVSNEFPCFTVRPDVADGQYIWGYFSLPSVWDEVLSLSSGGTPTSRNRLKEEQLLAMEIPLPPLAEQQRIVARIEELAAKTEEAKVLRKRAEEEAEALVAQEVKKLFTNSKEHGWTEGHLGDYVLDDRYGTSEKTTDDGSGTPILRMGNIQNGLLDITSLKYLHLSQKDRMNLLLAKGDILVNRTNSAELVGKCAVFDLDGEYAFASYLIRLRLDITKAEPRLIAAYVNSPAGRAYMFRERKQMTGQANVNSTKLKALPIALPDLAQQKRQLAYLDDLQKRTDALKALQAETSAELDALMPSILDKAFRGEL